MNPNAHNLHCHKFRAVYVLYTHSRKNYISAGVQECFLTASYHHTLLVIIISTDSTSAGVRIKLRLGCIDDMQQVFFSNSTVQEGFLNILHKM